MSNSSLANQVKRRGNSTVQKLNELRGEIDHLIKVADNATAALAKAQHQLSLVNYPGLNFISIRDALCMINQQSSQDWLPSVLATCGSGPWDEQEFDEFLQGRDIQLYEMPDKGVNGLVLGTSGWSEDNLSEQIYNRSPSSLRIYTQELLVVGLIAGRDPYDFLEQVTIDEVGQNHPAIQFILNQDFVWPWNEQLEDDDSTEEWEFEDGDWANESVLRQMGYNASANGPDAAERRRILRWAFESDNLPGIDSPEQRQRWGAENHLADYTRSATSWGWLINLQGSEKPAAREKWASDLKWLKREYYAKTMRFTWPSIAAAPATTTVLDPRSAWPFSDPPQAGNRSSGTIDWPPSPSTRKFLKPRHELAIIIGPEPRPSVESAVMDLREYINKKRLMKPGSDTIAADDLLFSLAGQMFIKDSDLPDLVAKHMNS